MHEIIRGCDSAPGAVGCYYRETHPRRIELVLPGDYSTPSGGVFHWSYESFLATAAHEAAHAAYHCMGIPTHAQHEMIDKAGI